MSASGGKGDIRRSPLDGITDPLPLFYFESVRCVSGGGMKRREFITLVGGLAAWPLAAGAQQPAKPVIGFLHIASPGAYVRVVAGFRRGLEESDFVEGRNVTVEYRWADGQLDRMPSLLADLLNHQPSVIVAS